jgi:hypothetical protein
VLLFGVLMDAGALSMSAGAGLIAWAVWHAVEGHRRRVRVGLQTGLIGLGLWSFLMASAHGAGLMLVPAVMPLCLSGPGSALTGSGSWIMALAALGVHTATMLAVIAVVSLVVHEWTGLAFLRRGWINLDLLWSIALAGSGVILLAI